MSTTDPQESTGLRRNAIGLGGAVIMSAALMGPAVSVYFNPQVSAAHAGAATPFVFALALVVMLVVASGVAQLARKFPSAGSFYTYVTNTLGPKTGFVTGGLMFAAYALLVPAELALIGTYAQDVLAQYGIHIHWALISAVFIVAMLYLSLRGITSSLRTALILFSAEVAVIVVLSIIVLVRGGAAGLTVAPLNPASSSHGLSGLALGMVFGILSYVGFEAATTLGEEVRDPHRNIPRALMLSLVFVGVIYLFCTYSEMVGFGVGQVDELVSETAPFTTLAARYAAWMGPLVGLAGISSIFAVVMNSNNGVVRIIYAMGREGMLPQRLGHVHPTHQTPSTAIWFQAVFAAAVTYLVGFIAGPFNAYVYLGSVLTLAIIPVYIFTQLGVMRFFRGEGRAEFSVWKHAILPVLGILLLLIPIYGQVYPVPDAPLRYFPYLVIMFIAVAAVAAAIIERKRAGLLQQAGAAMAGADDVADDPTRDPTPLR